MRAVRVSKHLTVVLLFASGGLGCGLDMAGDHTPEAATTAVKVKPGVDFCDDSGSWASPLADHAERLCNATPVACGERTETKTVGGVLVAARCQPFLAGPVNQLLAGAVTECLPANRCAPPATMVRVGPGAVRPVGFLVPEPLRDQLYPTSRSPISTFKKEYYFRDLTDNYVLFTGQPCKPKRIVLHVSQGPHCRSAANTFIVGDRDKDFDDKRTHFCIDTGGTYQFILPEMMGQHIFDGDTNRLECGSIGIEHAGVNKPASNAMYSESAKLVRWLCDKYFDGKCNRQNVLGHWHVHDKEESFLTDPNVSGRCPFDFDFDEFWNQYERLPSST